MTITFKVTGNDELKYISKLEESGMKQSDFIRSCIFNANIISQKDDVKRKELYQGLYGLKRAVDALKGSHKNLNIEAIEMEMNKLCHILSNS